MIPWGHIFRRRDHAHYMEILFLTCSVFFIPTFFHRTNRFFILSNNKTYFYDLNLYVQRRLEIFIYIIPISPKYTLSTLQFYKLVTAGKWFYIHDIFDLLASFYNVKKTRSNCRLLFSFKFIYCRWNFLRIP